MSLPWHRQTQGNSESWFLLIYTGEFKCSNHYRNTRVILLWKNRRHHKLSILLLLFCYCRSHSEALSGCAFTWAGEWGCQDWLLGGVQKRGTRSHGKSTLAMKEVPRAPGGRWLCTAPLREVLRHLESPGPATPLLWEQIQAREESPHVW